VPPVVPSGSGAAQVLIGGGMVAYSISVTDVPGITAGHIHRGAAGSNGPVLVDFAPTFAGNLAAGIVATSAQNVTDIIAGPAGFYVNIHTTANPAGAVRGQLTVPATSGAVGVPTLSEWAVILLALMLAAVAYRSLGRMKPRI
jgi:hypothetical protein